MPVKVDWGTMNVDNRPWLRTGHTFTMVRFEPAEEEWDGRCHESMDVQFLESDAQPRYKTLTLFASKSALLFRPKTSCCFLVAVPSERVALPATSCFGLGWTDLNGTTSPRAA